MSKPFRVTDPRPAGIVRLPDGKFANEKAAPHPTEIVEKADETGRTVAEVLEENKASIAQGKIPWGEAGPFNDANKKPMKLGD